MVDSLSLSPPPLYIFAYRVVHNRVGGLDKLFNESYVAGPEEENEMQVDFGRANLER